MRGLGQRPLADRLPPVSFFGMSAVFHYLGPSFAVLLFAHVDVMGVVWLRIASAALVFGAWRRPWHMLRRARSSQCWLIVALGVVLAGMNSLFYLAIDRLPLATVGAIEFLGPVLLAAAGAHTRRNALALALTVAGVFALTDVRLTGEALGFVFAFANCAGFMLYVTLAHRVANSGDSLDRLGMSMLVAAVVSTPFAIGSAAGAFTHPVWLLWGVGVGLCSSVIPYVSDQLAMARLPRATFALMLAVLPATATVVGLVVLAQVPTPRDLTGIGLVVAGLAAHRNGGARTVPRPDAALSDSCRDDLAPNRRESACRTASPISSSMQSTWSG
jgi:inner membrane transporter RhtA